MAHKKGGGTTRNGRDSESKRLTGVRQQRAQQFVALRLVLRARRLQQRDGFGHGAALHRRRTVQDAFDETCLNHPRAFRICSRTSLALKGMGVPGP